MGIGEVSPLLLLHQLLKCASLLYLQTNKRICLQLLLACLPTAPKSLSAPNLCTNTVASRMVLLMSNPNPSNTLFFNKQLVCVCVPVWVYARVCGCVYMFAAVLVCRSGGNLGELALSCSVGCRDGLRPLGLHAGFSFTKPPCRPPCVFT